MIRKQDLNAKITIRSRSKRVKKTGVTHPDGSGHEDVLLAKRRGVFGMALIVLAVLLLAVVV